jgi:hypothetical protein
MDARLRNCGRKTTTKAQNRVLGLPQSAIIHRFRLRGAVVARAGLRQLGSQRQEENFRMGRVRFVTVMVPVVSMFFALSLSASAQQGGGGVQQKGKPPPQRAAPVQRGPATGGRPGYHQAARPGPQQGGNKPGYAGRPAGRPGYAGRPAYFARHPGFARRGFGGHFYRGTLGWDRGAWRHEVRNGRYGWWWDVGGAWYFYEQPVYPYPTVISDVEVLEDPAMADAPPLDDGAPPGAYGPPDEAPPPGAYPAPVVVVPPPIIVAPPPIVCVGPLCVR